MNMKRVCAIMISFSVLLCFAACGKKEPSLMGTPTAAPEDAAAFEQTPERAATDYLERLTNVMYLYVDDDLRKGSVAELDEQVRKSIPMENIAFVPQEALGWRFSETPDSPLQVSDGMEFVLEKAKFYKESRLRQAVYRSDLKTAYEIQNTTTNGDFAQVSLLQTLLFRYEDTEEMAASAEAIDVIVYYYDGRWLIMDILTEDELDSMKESGFSAEAELQKIDSANAVNP